MSGERSAHHRGQTLPAVAGHGLRLHAGYTADPQPDGWLVRRAGESASRDPVQIEIFIRPGALPEEGDEVRLGERRLRRAVETVEGGSSGEGRLLTWREPLAAGVFAEYAQLRYADGGAPRFELDTLIRGGALAVVP
jgi:hypothetical protein